MDEGLFQLLINIMDSIVNHREQNIQQKWIDLAILKCNLRSGLTNLENNLVDIPPRDKTKVLDNYYKLKDMLWKAVGALHGNISAVSVAVLLEIRFIVSSSIYIYIILECNTSCMCSP